MNFVKVLLPFVVMTTLPFMCFFFFLIAWVFLVCLFVVFFKLVSPLILNESNFLVCHELQIVLSTQNLFCKICRTFE